MSTYFFPNLLKYQSECIVGEEIHKKDIAEDQFYFYRPYKTSLDFYLRRTALTTDIESIKLLKKGTLIFTDDIGTKEIMEDHNLKYDIENKYEDIHVSELSISFLMKKTR